MNRIHPPTRPTEAVRARSAFSIESGLFRLSECDLPLAFFGPKHYEANYAYPLIVWLHSPGGDERQLTSIMPVISLRNYVAVAPRGLCPGSEACGGRGYVWPQTQKHIFQAECRVLDAIEAAHAKYHVAENRVFLAGFGSGGTMAFRVGMNDPARFAGVLSICGPFPTGHTPFGCLAEARHLPVFLALGRDSRVYPPERACENLKLFHAAGISVTLRQYPCGQQLSEQMLRDVDRWIIEQITSRAERRV